MDEETGKPSLRIMRPWSAEAKKNDSDNGSITTQAL